jgi:hypothetical protein
MSQDLFPVRATIQRFLADGPPAAPRSPLPGFALPQMRVPAVDPVFSGVPPVPAPAPAPVPPPAARRARGRGSENHTAPGAAVDRTSEAAKEPAASGVAPKRMARTRGAAR